MANIVVKNTFLYVRHAATEESCAARKRCQSLPREWTPGAANISQWHFRYAIGMSVAAPSVSLLSQTSLPFNDPSPRSDSSFYSAKESSEDLAWSINPVDSCTRSPEDSHADSCDSAEDQDRVARYPSIEFTCATPSFSRSSSGYLCLEEDVVTVPSLQIASVTSTSPRNNSSNLCGEEDVATCPSMPFQCATPTRAHSTAGHVCQEESGAAGPSLQFNCASPSFNLPAYSLDSAGNLCQQSLSMCPVLQQAEELPEPENEPETSMDACTNRTSLKSQAPILQSTPTDASMDAVVSCLQMVPQAPAIQPMPKDARMGAVVSCLHMALVSCGRLREIKIDRDLRSTSSTWLSAELHSGPCASLRSYEVMNLVKQSLDAIIKRLHTLTLLSSRVQREDWGYSMRCSVACLPSGAEGSMCWDMFRKGHCPRHGQCRWYHPQDSDIGRLKVSVRNGEASNEEKLQTGSPDKKHKISLGELVH